MKVKNSKGGFKASRMFAELRANPAQPLAVIGIVKELDGDPTAVHLAIPPHADRWHAIPETSINSVEPLAKVTIDDQEHQLVRLQLKRPEDAHAALFHDLLAAQLAGTRALERHAAAEAGIAAATGYCYYDAAGCWICS